MEVRQHCCLKLLKYPGFLVRCQCSFLHPGQVNLTILRLSARKARSIGDLSNAQRKTSIILCQSRAARPGGTLEVDL